MKKLLKIVGYAFGALVIGFIALAVIGANIQPSSPSKSEPAAALRVTPVVTAAAAPVAPPPVPAAPPVSKPIAWDMNNPDAATNGNIRLAARSIKAGLNPLTGRQGDAASVLKAPWKFYGQPLCFAGTAGAVEDQPPGNDVAKAIGSKESSEVVIETDDGTVVDLLSMRSSGTLKVGDTVTVCGLATGRVEVVNQLGGKTTQLMLVGTTK